MKTHLTAMPPPDGHSGRDETLRGQIREGMAVLGLEEGYLGKVFAVGDHALALERGTFVAHEWRASFEEVERVDERGVWLRHGRGSLERISDAFAGPAEPYREAADASPIHQWSGFDPPAVARETEQRASRPESERPASKEADTDDDPPREH